MRAASPTRMIRRASRAVVILRQACSGGGDLWLACRMLGWAAVLPLLKRLLPLPRLVRIAWGGPGARKTLVGRECRIAQLAYAIFPLTYTPGEGRCLERSLLLYRFLSEAGVSPCLVNGVARGSGRVLGHAWVTVNDQPVGETEDELAPFVPVAAFGAAGELKRLNDGQDSPQRPEARMPRGGGQHAQPVD